MFARFYVWFVGCAWVYIVGFTVWLRLFWLVVIVAFVGVWGCFCVGLDFVFFVLFSYFVW